MAEFGLSIGCLCCGFNCRNIVYPTDFDVGWNAFELNEGDPITDSASFPQPLSIGQSLRPPSNVLLSSAQAWYHRIRFSGDIDITWDGLTIEVRPSAGTIESAGQTIPIMPPNSQTIWTDLTFVVTPDWYGVFFFNNHNNPTFPSPPYAGFKTSRGAIQVVDRLNDPSIRAVTLTSQSDETEVTSWLVSDMSVRISGEELVYCPQPALPDGTERFFQLHTAGSATYGGFRVPQTFNLISASPAYVNLIGPPGPIDWDWDDYVAQPTIADFPGIIGPFNLGHNQFAAITGGLDEWPFPTTASPIEALMQNAWRYPTIEQPYPKPEAKHQLIMRSAPLPGVIDDDIQYVQFDSAGRASATLRATMGIELEWQTV